MKYSLVAYIPLAVSVLIAAFLVVLSLIGIDLPSWVVMAALVLLLASFFFFTWAHFYLRSRVNRLLTCISSVLYDNERCQAADEITARYPQLVILQEVVMACREIHTDVVPELLSILKKVRMHRAFQMEKLRREVDQVASIASTISHIANGINEISEMSTEQAGDLKKLALLIHSLAESSGGLSGRIKEIVGNSEELAERAGKSEKELTGAVGEMMNMAADTRSVTDALAVIEDISDKINLLSLNAAIEAARAGESGRGFAVVSDEIARLADQTAESVRGIASMLDDKNRTMQDQRQRIDSSVGEAAAVMETVQDVNSEMLRLAKTFDDQLRMNDIIINEATHSRNRSEEIDDLTTEQKLAVYDVLVKSNEMKEITRGVKDEQEDDDPMDELERRLRAMTE